VLGLALVAWAPTAALAGEPAPRYSARFVQTRTLPALSRPFVTRGSVAVEADGSVEWRISEPLVVSYRIDAGGMTELRADGVERRIDASRAPWLGIIGDAMRALLDLDRGPLAERFEIVERNAAGLTELELRPRDAQLARGLERILVRGSGRHPDWVRIEQAAGARIEVEFSPGAT
jgi:Outer membrane lipoprotein carrier protein LolA-like